MNLLKREGEKIFCIGLNKTGTTTIENTFKEFGYKVGSQKNGELLIFDWYNRKFDSILKFCKSAEAFQDIPFSLPYTYIPINQLYKKSKFVLTVRDSPEQWYNSLCNFHSKVWGDGNLTPTIEQLKNGKSLYPGFAYELVIRMFNTDKSDLYNKEKLISFYNNHIFSVKEYFKSQPGKLIVINVSNKLDYKKLALFLDKPCLRNDFLWKNKTNNNLSL